MKEKMTHCYSSIRAKHKPLIDDTYSSIDLTQTFLFSFQIFRPRYDALLSHVQWPRHSFISTLSSSQDPRDN